MLRQNSLISPKLIKRTCIHDQIVNNRLTDPVLRESYLNFGHPDGSKHQEPHFRIALPKKVVGNESMAFLLTYLVLLSVVVPGYATAWWIRSQSKTAHGFHESTACQFFSAVSHRKALKFPEIITLLSTSHEVTSAIESELLEIQFLSKVLPLIQNRQLHLENIEVPLSTSKLMTAVSSCRSSRVRPCPENLSPSAPSTYQRQNYHNLSSPRRVSVDLCRRSQIQRGNGGSNPVHSSHQTSYYTRLIIAPEPPPPRPLSERSPPSRHYQRSLPHVESKESLHSFATAIFVPWDALSFPDRRTSASCTTGFCSD